MADRARQPARLQRGQRDRAVRHVAQGKAIGSGGADGRVPVGGYERRRVAQVTNRCGKAGVPVGAP